jgi:hypothetical protein
MFFNRMDRKFLTSCAANGILSMLWDKGITPKRPITRGVGFVHEVQIYVKANIHVVRLVCCFGAL